MKVSIKQMCGFEMLDGYCTLSFNQVVPDTVQEWYSGPLCLFHVWKCTPKVCKIKVSLLYDTNAH